MADKARGLQDAEKLDLTEVVGCAGDDTTVFSYQGAR
jgi:hypothetical protein